MASILENNIEISPPERFLAAEITYELNDKGEILERSAHIKLVRNIRFAFALYEKAHNLQTTLDVSSEWWFCLRESIKVRDRLTHPRLPEDLDISPKELINAIKAKNGFEETLLEYGNLSEK